MAQLRLHKLDSFGPKGRDPYRAAMFFNINADS